MTPTHFWIATGITLIITIACIIINNAHFQLLKQLISFLQGNVKKILFLNGQPDKARQVTRDDVPKLEQWYNECQNYGLINLLGLVSVTALAVSGGVYHSISYIIVMASALFLVLNILYLPKTFNRLNQAIAINNNYLLLMMTFDQTQELKKDDTGSTSSS